MPSTFKPGMSYRSEPEQTGDDSANSQNIEVREDGDENRDDVTAPTSTSPQNALAATMSASGDAQLVTITSAPKSQSSALSPVAGNILIGLLCVAIILILFLVYIIFRRRSKKVSDANTAGGTYPPMATSTWLGREHPRVRSRAGTSAIWGGASVRSSSRASSEPIAADRVVGHIGSDTSTIRGNRLARVRMSLLRDRQATQWTRLPDSFTKVKQALPSPRPAHGYGGGRLSFSGRNFEEKEGSNAFHDGRGLKSDGSSWRDADSLFSFSTTTR